MTSRRTTIGLESGDVRKLQIRRGKHTFRLAIYDENPAMPLIQAIVREAQRRAIRRALGEAK